MKTDKYLSGHDVGALFDASPEAAERELQKAGVYPIRLGNGKIRRKRWLQSAVMEALQSLHERAQPRPKEAKPPRKKIGIAGMTTAELLKLTKKDAFTAPQTIQ